MPRVHILPFLVVLGAFAASPLPAQERVHPPAILGGEWDGSMQMDSGPHAISLEFHLTDSTFAGTVYLDGSSFGEMQNPSVRGDTVHFNVDRLDFTGVVTGSRMNVALIVYNGSTRHLTLTRRAAPGGDRSP